MFNLQTTYYKTPIGTAKIAGDKNGIQSISVLDEDIDTSKEIPQELQKCVSQLDEYFAGKRTEFNLKLNPQGTDFQKSVWRHLATIPFGETQSYGQLAATLERPKASRAVGAANGANPIAIILPCHRVIGGNGSLTGFGGGLPTKEYLLTLEGVLTPSFLVS